MERVVVTESIRTSSEGEIERKIDCDKGRRYSRVTKLATVNSKEVLLGAVDSKRRIGESIWNVRLSQKVSKRVRKEKPNARSIARKDKDYWRKFEKIGDTIWKSGEKKF